MKKHIPLAATLVLFMFMNEKGGQLSAQSFSAEVIGSAGTFATSANGSIAWTIGEVMTETYSYSSISFTQGFHQPDVSGTLTVTNLLVEKIYVYPNPVVNNLVIDLALAPGKHVLYVYDMHGQLVCHETIPDGQQQFTLSFLGFTNGIYLINIINSVSSIKSSFKINKEN